ncbi:hypothetical protein PT974_03194 [Cladobotryum mycophilum]|uniref:Uncharacterized protein n=1 Tax=Cladobotryum mycophilum TaxID=491253 RepID=A0ABR0SRL6_9HYPO
MSKAHDLQASPTKTPFAHQRILRPSMLTALRSQHIKQRPIISLAGTPAQEIENAHCHAKGHILGLPQEIKQGFEK